MRSTTAPSATARPQQFLGIALAGVPYAMGLEGVREIIAYQAPTPVPLMPTCLRGVIALRGAVVPVLDLAARLGLASSPVGKRSCIVIAELATQAGLQPLGLVVDAVSEVMEVPPDHIEPPPSFGAGLRADFLLGLAPQRGRLVVLLDLARVLALDELQALPALASSCSPTACPAPLP